jgi:hypothetical protein
MAKKNEGNEQEKRANAREAREHRKSASEVGATTGASKQIDHETDPKHPKQKTTHPVER